MIPTNPRTGAIYRMNSVQTGQPTNFRLLTKSSVDPKLDVFINRTTCRPVYRDSIRRKYY